MRVVELILVVEVQIWGLYCIVSSAVGELLINLIKGLPHVVEWVVVTCFL